MSPRNPPKQAAVPLTGRTRQTVALVKELPERAAMPLGGPLDEDCEKNCSERRAAWPLEDGVWRDRCP